MPVAEGSSSPWGVRAPGETKQDRLGRSKSERRKRRGDEAKAGAPYEEGRAGGARDRGARGPGAGPGRGAGEGAGDRRRLRRRDDAPRPVPGRAGLPLHARVRPRRRGRGSRPRRLGVALGQRVAALTQVGAHAQYVALPAGELVLVPAGVDAAEAASLPVNYVTAHQMLFRVTKVKPGERILVHGA